MFGACDRAWAREAWERSSELARTLVLLRGDDEVLRVPLQLVPGELAVIRPSAAEEAAAQAELRAEREARAALGRAAWAQSYAATAQRNAQRT